MMRAWRIAGTVLVAGTLLIPIGLVAEQSKSGQKGSAQKGSTQRAPAPVDRPLANDRTGVPARPVDVLTVTGPEASRLVPLWRIGPGDYSGAEYVDLLFATYKTRPEIVRAEFRVGTCVFRLAAPVTLEDNSNLTLAREKPCRDRSSNSAELLVVARGNGRIAWWTWEMPTTAAVMYQGLTMTAPDAKGKTRSIVRGRLYSKPR